MPNFSPICIRWDGIAAGREWEIELLEMSKKSHLRGTIYVSTVSGTYEYVHTSTRYVEEADPAEI